MLIYISSDGSNYMSSLGALPIGFHSFITLLNDEAERKTLHILPDKGIDLEAGESITLSKWQSRAPRSIYLNLENIYHEQNVNFYSGLVSLSSRCNVLHLLSLPSFFSEYSEEKIVYDNSAQFAVELWNYLSEKTITSDEVITPLWLYHYLHNKKNKTLEIPFQNCDQYGYIDDDLYRYDKKFLKDISEMELSSFDDELACHLYKVITNPLCQNILIKKTGVFNSIRTSYYEQCIYRKIFHPTSITIYSGALIDGFSLCYKGESINHIGSNTTGVKQDIIIPPGEYITSVKIYANNDFVRDIWFVSQLGNLYGIQGYDQRSVYTWHEIHFQDNYALAYVEQENEKGPLWNTLALYSCPYEEEE